MKTARSRKKSSIFITPAREVPPIMINTCVKKEKHFCAKSITGRLAEMKLEVRELCPYDVFPRSTLLNEMRKRIRQERPPWGAPEI